MKRNLSMLAIGLFAVAFGPMSAAQSTSTSTSTSTSSDHPIPVGTSQQTADLANRKAVQDGATATVVRTGPSAADRLRGATSSAGDKAARAKTNVKAKTRARSTDDTAAATSTTTKP